MLICGTLDESITSKKLRQRDNHILSYFFCQATDDPINNASAALHGLISLPIDQQPLLISHIRRRYDHADKAVFEDVNAWVALYEIFISILQNPSLKSIYLIIDALDECKANVHQLLDLTSQDCLNNPSRQMDFDDTQMRLSLELNEEHVSRAVQMLIDFKVSILRLIEDDSALQEAFGGQIYAMVNGTFISGKEYLLSNDT
ncbi:beta transducin-like protein HET-D2Y [Calycina marina]|uniref:Beta transducin-like protein HET-D2Y n=1 Tax=Calycina marina TaxID=1763456 RepID=A0A9P8CG78_9HELO|nr:beta transducin-like protein HET-D2Y [Calycina marina]